MDPGPKSVINSYVGWGLNQFWADITDKSFRTYMKQLSMRTAESPPDVCHLIENQVFVSELSTIRTSQVLKTKYQLNSMLYDLDDDYTEMNTLRKLIDKHGIQLLQTGTSESPLVKDIGKKLSEFHKTVLEKILNLPVEQRSNAMNVHSIQQVLDEALKGSEKFYVDRWVSIIEEQKLFESISEMGVFGLTLSRKLARLENVGFHTLYGLVKLVQNIPNEQPHFTSSGTVFMMLDNIVTQQLVIGLVQKVKNWCRDRPNTIQRIVCCVPTLSSDYSSILQNLATITISRDSSNCSNSILGI